MDKYFPIGEAEDGSAVIMSLADSGGGQIGIFFPDDSINGSERMQFESFSDFLLELEHVEEDEYEKFILDGVQG